MGYKDKLTGHGIRRTLSTALNELRFEEDHVESQLSHVGKNPVRKAYNHAMHVSGRQWMMQIWADLLDKWEQEGVADLKQELINHPEISFQAFKTLFDATEKGF